MRDAPEAGSEEDRAIPVVPFAPVAAGGRAMPTSTEESWDFLHILAFAVFPDEAAVGTFLGFAGPGTPGAGGVDGAEFRPLDGVGLPTVVTAGTDPPPPGGQEAVEAYACAGNVLIVA